MLRGPSAAPSNINDFCCGKDILDCAYFERRISNSTTFKRLDKCVAFLLNDGTFYVFSMLNEFKEVFRATFDLPALYAIDKKHSKIVHFDNAMAIVLYGKMCKQFKFALPYNKS